MSKVEKHGGSETCCLLNLFETGRSNLRFLNGGDI